MTVKTNVRSEIVYPRNSYGETTRGSVPEIAIRASKKYIIFCGPPR